MSKWNSGFKSLAVMACLSVPTVGMAQDGSLIDPDNAAEEAIEAARKAAEEAEAAAKAAEEAEQAAEEAGEAAEAAAEVAEVAAEEVAAEETVEEDDGNWETALSVGANAAATYVNNVVGASANGTTYQFGAVISGGADWSSGQHTFSNELNIQHTRTKTPQLDLFVKSADLVTFNSTYLFALEKVDWLGPFARFKLNSALFPGYEVYSDPVVVIPSELDIVSGDIVPGYEDIDPSGVVAPQQKIPLTSFLEPLLLRESAGMFANPVKKKEFKLKTKLGVGVQETITRGGYVNADDDTTPEIEYAALVNSTQAGGELSIDMAGTLKKNLSWSASAGFFLPFITSTDAAPTGLEGLNSDLGLNIGLKLNKWASLDYAFSARKVPSVTPDWQVQTGVMLSASFNVIE